MVQIVHTRGYIKRYAQCHLRPEHACLLVLHISQINGNHLNLFFSTNNGDYHHNLRSVVDSVVIIIIIASVVVVVVVVSVSVIYFYSVVLLVGIGCSSEPALLLGHHTLLDCVLPPGC